MVDEAKTDTHAPSVEVMWRTVGAMDGAIRRYIRRRVPDVTEGEDVLHGFYLRVFEHANTLRDGGSARSWLYRLLRSALMDHFRANHRQFRVAHRLESQARLSTVESTPSDHPSLVEMLAELKPEYSDILERLEVRSDKPWEVALDLGTTPNNIRVRHFRARAALREAYVKHDREMCSGCDKRSA